MTRLECQRRYIKANKERLYVWHHDKCKCGKNKLKRAEFCLDCFKKVRKGAGSKFS